MRDLGCSSARCEKFLFRLRALNQKHHSHTTEPSSQVPTQPTNPDLLQAFQGVPLGQKFPSQMEQLMCSCSQHKAHKLAYSSMAMPVCRHFTLENVQADGITWIQYLINWNCPAFSVLLPCTTQSIMHCCLLIWLNLGNLRSNSPQVIWHKWSHSTKCSESLWRFPGYPKAWRTFIGKLHGSAEIHTPDLTEGGWTSNPLSCFFRKNILKTTQRHACTTQLWLAEIVCKKRAEYSHLHTHQLPHAYKTFSLKGKLWYMGWINHLRHIWGCPTLPHHSLRKQNVEKLK